MVVFLFMIDNTKLKVCLCCKILMDCDAGIYWVYVRFVKMY